ncbi:DUF1642 domain-containing protein [Streptococcus salivarius]
MMDRQEAVQRLSKGGRLSIAHAEDLYDSIVPKPVIPRYIAEYLEKVKSDGDLTVVGAVNEAPDGRVGDWLILERVNTFAQAWFNGYEVEKEARYRVKIKGTGQYLTNDGNWPHFNLNFKTDFTKAEIELFGLGWVFDSEGVEIEEVE